MEERLLHFHGQEWKTIFLDIENGMKLDTDDTDWKLVNIPHNWEDYQGYRKQSHGNLHGTAWYRKWFDIKSIKQNKHTFIRFEGVGSYADVYLNEVHIGRHEGGLTGFDLEMTKALRDDKNLLAVRADHPEGIKDLPWVCGGCFGTPNSEGSQPLGVIRPVSVYSTGAVRITPHSVGICPIGIKEGHPIVHICTEIENLENTKKGILLKSIITSPEGKVVEEIEKEVVLQAFEKKEVEQLSREIKNAQLWSLDFPSLYQVTSIIYENGEFSDNVTNSFGLRYIEWENFSSYSNLDIDYKKAIEEPCKENNYFCNRTICQNISNADVAIADDGVKVTLNGDLPEHTIICFEVEVVNQSKEANKIVLECFVQTYNATKSIANLKTEVFLIPGESKKVVLETNELNFLDQWTEKNPFLHGVYTTIRKDSDDLKVLWQMYTSFGIFKTNTLANRGYAFVEKKDNQGKVLHRFLLNGKHVFINGTAEYEHLLGNDHAFTTEQIMSRMNQISAAGFNALREAHCPHDLRYIDYCDKNGILYWAQMGTHLYFDNERFRSNFLNLTEEFVKERRNSPSLILWGLQNESILPGAFADKLRTLIKKLDSTASVERMVTTCNGGYGSDWNVPQNWSGTYGGSVLDYQTSLRKQLLVGEYGQYRVLGKHEEGDLESHQNSGGNVSEELFCYCLENKVRLAEQIKDEIYGQFQWIFTSHANPGREVVFCLDAHNENSVGVVNSKGLLTCWGEPVDAFYMYRSHYVSAEKEPMVYIVSHTWPDRFKTVGHKADISVYSNCDEVELYNGLNGNLLGRLTKKIIGEHFVFLGCEIKYNILIAVGYVNEKPVAKDYVLLENLPIAEGLSDYFEKQPDLLAPQQERYIYRINCGGDEYIDPHGSIWEADCMYSEGKYGWVSWAMEYDDINPILGSVRKISEFIKGVKYPELFQSYRYGREKLSYIFKVEPGDYNVELYFIEPWYGIGGGMNCTGWRLFDVAINDKVVLKNMDIWKEVDTLTACKKVIPISVEGTILKITFPNVASYQAIISGIAISTGE